MVISIRALGACQTDIDLRSLASEGGTDSVSTRCVTLEIHGRIGSIRPQSYGLLGGVNIGSDTTLVGRGGSSSTENELGFGIAPPRCICGASATTDVQEKVPRAVPHGTPCMENACEVQWKDGRIGFLHRRRGSWNNIRGGRVKKRNRIRPRPPVVPATFRGNSVKM